MARRTLIPGEVRILHGGDYNPDQWLDRPDILAEDRRLRKLAGCHTFSVGIFAWTALEPREGAYDFGWLDRVMDDLAEDGCRAILATPSGAKPAWMAKRYPEIRRVNRAGLREPYGGRHNHCWSSPVYRDKVAAINTALAERYAGHPALGMWHLSNEYSGHCYCPLCLAEWARWLEKRYGTLESLNAAWWTAFWSHTYTDWDEIDPRDDTVDGLRLDWMRFLTWQCRDFIRHEAAPLRARTPDLPVTTNFMGLFDGLNYAEIAEELDVVADDQYPTFDPGSGGLLNTAVYIGFKDDLHRCFKPDRPWMLMESCPGSPQWKHPMRLKRPGMHRLEMLQALAHGAEGTCYFQWRAGRGAIEKYHGAVVDHTGTEHTRIFQDVTALGATYAGMNDLLGSAREAEVGLLYDWDTKWAFEIADGTASDGGAYGQVAIDHYRPFWEQGVAVDVLDQARTFDGYRLLVAPQLYLLKEGVAERLRAFVEGGGTLVATAYTGWVGPTGLTHLGGWPGEGLRKLFGVWDEETDWLGADRTVLLEASGLGLPSPSMARNVAARLHAEGAEVVARYASEFYAGSPAVTVNRVGQGRAIYVGAHLDSAALRALYGWLARDLDLSRATGMPVPEGVFAGVRTQPEGGRFLFLLNFTDRGQMVPLHPSLAGPPNVELSPFGAEVLRL